MQDTEMNEMYAQGFSVENVGFKTEDNVGNIDLFRELQLLKYIDGIDWLDSVTFNGDEIMLGDKPIVFKLVGGKYKLYTILKAKTKKMPEKNMEIKGRDKSIIILKWLSQSEHSCVLLSQADWTQLLVLKLNMKLSINVDGYMSVAPYDASKAYYKQEKKVRYEMRHDGEEVLNNLVRATESKHESAFNQVDRNSINEYSQAVIEQAILVLEEYDIDCDGLVLPYE